ncbi:MAG: alpha/beta fold hydrolase [Treponema sp.]|nr:alpha/beta fold hydrolase [Treponema sp.]
MKKKNLRVSLLIILTLTFLTFIGCTIITMEVYSQTFGRTEGFLAGNFYTYFTWNDIDQNKYSRQTVHFNSGGNRLQGFIYGSANNKGLVVISHGLGGTADAYFPLIMNFVDNGWRVFAYNNTGVAGSEGSSIRGLSQSMIDLDAALKYVASNNALNSLPLMLVGHSWGGFAVCSVLNFDHNVNAVVSFAGFNSARDIFKEQGIAFVGGVYYLLTPSVWSMERQIFGDMINLTAVGGINKTDTPIMLVQSSDDDIVLADSSSIYAHRVSITNPNLEIIFYDGDEVRGHNFVYGSLAQRQYMESATDSWESFKEGHQTVNNALMAEWAEGYNFDKTRANELDPVLMNRINAFFTSNL